MSKIGEVVRVCALALAVLVVSAGLIHAGATPAQKCVVAKIKAAAKEQGARLKCFEKAVTQGVSVDPNCLTATTAKFDTTIIKVESKGGCAVTGDGSAIESAAAVGAQNVAALAQGGGGECCGGIPFSSTPSPTCYQFDPTVLNSENDCIFNAPGVVSANAACSSDGTCTSGAPQPGDCCDTVNFAAGEICIFADANSCAVGFGGVFHPNAVCTKSGCVP